MRTFNVLFISFAMFVSGCAPIFEPSYGTRIPLETSWKVFENNLTPEQYLRSEDAWAFAETQTGNLGLIIWYQNKVVFERYHSDFDVNGNPKKRHWMPSRTKHMYSATKGLAGLLVGVAVKQNILALDDHVDKYLPEFITGREGQDLNRAKELTIKDLLTLTSGLESPPISDKYFSQLIEPIHKHEIYDFSRYVMRLNMENDPGERWNYFSGQLELLSAVLREAIKAKTGQTVKEFADTCLFRPIGFHYSYWNEDGAGNPTFFAGLYTNAREMSKLGNILLYPGDILDADWLSQSRNAASEPSPAYGLTLMLNKANPWDYFGDRITKPVEPPWPNAPDDTVIMPGFKNNDVWIIESLKLVIMRISDSEGDGLGIRKNKDDDDFFKILFGTDKEKKYW